MPMNIFVTLAHVRRVVDFLKALSWSVRCLVEKSESEKLERYSSSEGAGDLGLSFMLFWSLSLKT